MILMVVKRLMIVLYIEPTMTLSMKSVVEACRGIIMHVQKVQKVGVKEVHMMPNYSSFLAILVTFAIVKSQRVMTMKVRILVRAILDTSTQKIAI